MKKTLALLLCAAALITLFAGCGGKSKDPGASPSGDSGEPAPGAQSAEVQETREDMIYENVMSEIVESPSYKEDFVIGGYMAISTLDLQAPGNDVPGAGVFYKLGYETLVTIGAGNVIEPKLAESWEQIDDTTWEFKLRKGVHFHNGEELKASDVAFTYERSKTVSGSYTASLLEFVDSVEVVDDYTARFHLKYAYMDILLVLADSVCGIISEKALTDDPDEGFKVGTGPWVADEFLSNDSCKFVPFDSYWGDQPLTKRMVYRYITENAARLIALQSGELDVCINPPNSGLADVENDPEYKVITYKNANQVYVGFNLQDELCSDINFRLAIAHAINKANVAFIVVDGFAVLGNTSWGGCTFGLDGDLKGYEYDPELAKEYLAKAGYPDGVDIEITTAFPGHVSASTVLQSELAEVGINVKINEMDYPGLMSYTSWNSPKHQLVVFSTGWTMAADSCRVNLYPGASGNTAGKDVPEMTELIDAARSEKDEQKRLEMYKQIQQINEEQVVTIPLYWTIVAAVMKANVGGVMWSPTGYHDFSQACVAVG